MTVEGSSVKFSDNDKKYLVFRKLRLSDLYKFEVISEFIDIIVAITLFGLIMLVSTLFLVVKVDVMSALMVATCIIFVVMMYIATKLSCLKCVDVVILDRLFIEFSNDTALYPVRIKFGDNFVTKIYISKRNYRSIIRGSNFCFVFPEVMLL